MQVRVNGEERDLPDGATAADLVGDRVRGVAVAVNDAVVPRGSWSEAILRAGDRVEILEPHQGG